MQLTPFHLAIRARDIAEAREFYGLRLGLPEGRSSTDWVDFNLFGHQLVTHLDVGLGPTGRVPRITNGVDGEGVPIPHFGVVLGFADWDRLVERVSAFIDQFVIEPTVRFAGLAGEQRTMFFLDPSGNALEFKAFANIERELFATDR